MKTLIYWHRTPDIFGGIAALAIVGTIARFFVDWTDRTAGLIVVAGILALTAQGLILAAQDERAGQKSTEA